MIKKYFSNNILIWGTFVIALIVFSCANPVAPMGGPKDTTPPKVVTTTPENYSVNNNKKEFHITFDEFVITKSLNQQLLVSPPLKGEIESKLSGHTLTVKFSDTLKENTTYTFNFRNTIVDLHEENPLENYNYIFSTGDIIDSLKITGQILHASNRKPAADILVMLYDSYDDSVSIRERPYYIASTDENGNFTLPHLRSNKYKIFALKDANNNLLFDIPTEKIAFLDTLIFPQEISQIKDAVAENDSIIPDSLNTNKKDSIILSNEAITMFLFTEKDTVLSIKNSKLFENKYFITSFSKAVPEAHFNILKPEMDSTAITKEWNSNHDSVTVWLHHFENDSLVVQIYNCDTILDTLTFTYLKKEEHKRDKNEEIKPERFHLKADIKGKNQLLEHPLRIIADSPIKNILSDSLILITPKDTINTSFKKTGIRNIEIDYDWEENSNYSIIIPDSTFFDINDLTQDSTNIKFSTKGNDYYGTLIIHITIPENTSPQIIQLSDADEKEIIFEQTIPKSTTLKIPFLEPQKYKLRAISDNNGNGKWDSGIYLMHLQPEEITYLPNLVEIMGNWDIEVNWKIKP